MKPARHNATTVIVSLPESLHFLLFPLLRKFVYTNEL